MSAIIVAKRIRKQWISWIVTNLKQPEPLSEQRGLELQEELNRKIAQEGDQLSYEVQSVTATNVLDAVLKCIQLDSFDHLVSFIGDPLVPAVLILNLNDLRILLEKAIIDDKVISIALKDLTGTMTIDMTLNNSVDGEVLISGGGRLEQAVINISNILPGGILYRGR